MTFEIRRNLYVMVTKTVKMDQMKPTARLTKIVTLMISGICFFASFFGFLFRSFFFFVENLFFFRFLFFVKFLYILNSDDRIFFCDFLKELVSFTDFRIFYNYFQFFELQNFLWNLLSIFFKENKNKTRVADAYFSNVK